MKFLGIAFLRSRVKVLLSLYSGREFRRDLQRNSAQQQQRFG